MPVSRAHHTTECAQCKAYECDIDRLSKRVDQLSEAPNEIKEIIKSHWYWNHVWDRANESHYTDTHLKVLDYLLSIHPELAEEASLEREQELTKRAKRNLGL